MTLCYKCLENSTYTNSIFCLYNRRMSFCHSVRCFWPGNFVKSLRQKHKECAVSCHTAMAFDFRKKFNLLYIQQSTIHVSYYVYPTFHIPVCGVLWNMHCSHWIQFLYPMTSIKTSREKGYWELCDFLNPSSSFPMGHGIKARTHTHWEIT